MQDISLVRHTYEQMTDEQLKQFAATDSVGLTPAALGILKDEIRKRNLDTVFIEHADAHNKAYSEEEIDQLCEIIRSLPCPVTGKSDQRLNATITMEVKSFIFFTRYTRKIVVASPPALRQANDLAISSSLAFGLWGIPWGVIKTIEAVIVNSRNKKNARFEEPTAHLRSFVTENVGHIVMMKDNREALSRLLKSTR